MRDKLFFGLMFLLIMSIACNDDKDIDDDMIPCESDQVVDQSRGACNETLNFSSVANENLTNDQRIIDANSIPEHKVGLFGMGMGALNPNAISPQSEKYILVRNPQKSATLTPLLSTTGSGPNAGPQYSFGILFNGVELDPVAAEPFPHEGVMSPNVNWQWNLEALNVNLGLDCNSAHVQPNGKYHYHGKPTLFLEALSISPNTMTIIGYAADGFPIYYKYAYSEPQNAQSPVITMTSSYQLKDGHRPGDGETAPCGGYNGVYSNDYEYIDGLGTLDEANGREGVTPEFPNGTYYYVITDEFPSIPRYFRGNPSVDFKIGA